MKTYETFNRCRGNAIDSDICVLSSDVLCALIPENKMLVIRSYQPPKIP